MNQKGITLIALVITIIVLLILAGVTIKMTFGDDGIIDQAKESKKTQRDEQISEKLEIWKAEKDLAKKTGEPARDEKTFLQELIDDGLIDAKKPEDVIDDIKDRNGNVIYEKEKEKITFTIEQLPNKDGNYTYQAEKGMTWAEWIKSDYNTITEEILNADYGGEPEVSLYTVNGYEQYGDFVYLRYWYTWEGLLTYEDKLILGSSEIVEGYIYASSEYLIGDWEINDEMLPDVTAPFTITYGDTTYNLKYDPTKIHTWEYWVTSEYNTNTINLDISLIIVDACWLITFDNVSVEIYDSNGNYVGDQDEINSGNYTMRETPYFKIDNNVVHVPTVAWNDWGVAIDCDTSISFEDNIVTYDGKPIYYNGEVVTTSSGMIKNGEYTTTK